MTISNENGRIGENIAAEFYEANGYTVICRNYRSGHNEIDIIAEDNDSIAFAEVKTRTESPALLKYGSAKSAVDARKRERLVSAALDFIKRTKKTKQPRMDVVEIYLDENGRLARLNYIRCAFGRQEAR